MHGGTSRFLDEDKALRIAVEFEKNYEMEKSEALKLESRAYTSEDKAELLEHGHEEQPCKAPEDKAANLRGIGSERADDRQPVEYERKDYEYVIDFRTQGKKYLQNVSMEVERVKAMADYQSEVERTISTASRGSPVHVAEAAFSHDVSVDTEFSSRLIDKKDIDEITDMEVVNIIQSQNMGSPNRRDSNEVTSAAIPITPANAITPLHDSVARSASSSRKKHSREEVDLTPTSKENNNNPNKKRK